MTLEIIPVKIEEEIEPNTDILDLILESTVINDYDILIFSQKIISKNEGRIVDLSSVNPSLLASGIANSYGKDPRLVELILSESKRIVRMQDGVIIVESNHGFVCANAGIDESNVRDGYVTMLPIDPDQSADKLRKQIEQRTKITAIAIADELCSASELVMGKVKNSPVAIVRNFKFDFSDAKIQKIIRPKTEDMFR